MSFFKQDPIERQKSFLRKYLLRQDPCLDYADIVFDFRDFNEPKSVVYTDGKQVLHIYMDSCFSQYSAHKLKPIAIHLMKWYEGLVPTMYPENIWTILSRPEILSTLKHKFDVYYSVPPKSWVEPEDLKLYREDIIDLLENNHPRMYKFFVKYDVKVSWRKAPKDLLKVPIADTDPYTNRIFLDPAVATAPETVGMYILRHELAVIKDFNYSSLKADKAQLSKTMHETKAGNLARNYMLENGWWFKYE